LGAAFEQAKPTPDPDRAQALEDALVARLYELKRQDQRKSTMQASLTYPRPTTRAWSGFITTAVTVAAFALLTVALAFQTPPPNGDNGGYAAPVNGDLSQREGSPTPTPFPMTLIPEQGTPTPAPFEGQPTVPPPDITATPIPFDGTALQLPCRQFEDLGASPQTIPWPQTAPTMPAPCGDGESFFILPDGSRAIIRPTALPFSTQEAARPVITFAASRLVTLDLSAPLDISQLSAGQTVVLYLPVLTSINELNRDSIELVPVGVGRVTHRNPGTDSVVILMTAPTQVEQISRWTDPNSRSLIAVEVIE
jgi:hypothetical protein